MPPPTIEPQRLYRQIAEQLRLRMGQSEFAAGSRLPAERDLAKQLGVSRPTVREALIALEVEGWVEVRSGSGVYVRERAVNQRTVPTDPLPPEWGPLALIRARRVVEGETAALAAIQAKRRDIAAMRQAIDSMAQDSEQGLAPLAGDRAFHTAIVQASGNGVLVETVQTFWDSRHGPVHERLGGHFETVPSWRAAMQEHEAVLSAIRSRDPAAARDAMHCHMDKSHARFSASWRRTRK